MELFYKVFLNLWLFLNLFHEGVVFYVENMQKRHIHWRLRGGGDTWHVATATGNTDSVVAISIGASGRLNGSAGLTSDFSFAGFKCGLQHLQVLRRRLKKVSSMLVSCLLEDVAIRGSAFSFSLVNLYIPKCRRE